MAKKNVLFLFVGRTEGQAENLRLVYNGIRINAEEEGFKDILFNNLQCRLEIEKKRKQPHRFDFADVSLH